MKFHKTFSIDKTKNEKLKTLSILVSINKSNNRMALELVRDDIWGWYNKEEKDKVNTNEQVEDFKNCAYDICNYLSGGYMTEQCTKMLTEQKIENQKLRQDLEQQRIRYESRFEQQKIDFEKQINELKEMIMKK